MKIKLDDINDVDYDCCYSDNFCLVQFKNKMKIILPVLVIKEVKEGAHIDVSSNVTWNERREYRQRNSLNGIQRLISRYDNGKNIN